LNKCKLFLGRVTLFYSIFVYYICSANIDRMTFGQKLIEARKSKGFSQEQLGNMIDVDKRIISRYETDKTIPSIDVAKKMANAIQISLDYLTELDYSLYIHDEEMTKLLKGYDKLKDEDKNTINKIIKAFSFYSKVQETQIGLAS
jgi:transcriptional regulator with XRE-family HTH domain